jgi:hypothetical protein
MPFTLSDTPFTFGFLKQTNKPFAMIERQAILRFRRQFIKDGGPSTDLRPGEIIIMERGSLNQNRANSNIDRIIIRNL